MLVRWCCECPAISSTAGEDYLVEKRTAARRLPVLGSACPGLHEADIVVIHLVGAFTQASRELVQISLTGLLVDIS